MRPVSRRWLRASNFYFLGYDQLKAKIPVQRPELGISSPYNVVHHLRAGLARPWLVTKCKSLANLEEVYARSTGTFARVVKDRSRQVHALVSVQGCEVAHGNARKI